MLSVLNVDHDDEVPEIKQETKFSKPEFKIDCNARFKTFIPNLLLCLQYVLAFLKETEEELDCLDSSMIACLSELKHFDAALQNLRQSTTFGGLHQFQYKGLFSVEF